MEKYIKLEWPESQEWMEDEYKEVVYWCDNMMVFVPEKLYKEKNGIN